MKMRRSRGRRTKSWVEESMTQLVGLEKRSQHDRFPCTRL